MTIPPGAGSAAERARLQAAARQLETLVVKELVRASKAFTGGAGAGSAIRADLFADALSDALVRGGGLGLARRIEQALQPDRGAADDGHDRAAAGQPPPAPATGAALPAVTSAFGLRHDPLDGHLTRHEGVDLGAPEGTAIRAAAGGVVRRAADRGGYGTAVEIDHGGGLTTLYAHASVALVREGETVAPGQAIARVGHSGRATGPHLHFEVRVAGVPVDPSRALKRYALRADGMVDTGS